jgi:hypothetical protein
VHFLHWEGHEKEHVPKNPSGHTVSNVYAFRTPAVVVSSGTKINEYTLRISQSKPASDLK